MFTNANYMLVLLLSGVTVYCEYMVSPNPTDGVLSQENKEKMLQGVSKSIQNNAGPLLQSLQNVDWQGFAQKLGDKKSKGDSESASVNPKSTDGVPSSNNREKMLQEVSKSIQDNAAPLLQSLQNIDWQGLTQKLGDKKSKSDSESASVNPKSTDSVPSSNNREKMLQGVSKSIQDNAGPLLQSLQNIDWQGLAQKLGDKKSKSDSEPVQKTGQFPTYSLEPILKNVDVQSILQKMQVSDLQPAVNKLKEGDVKPLVQKIQTEVGPIVESVLKNVNLQPQRQKRSVHLGRTMLPFVTYQHKRNGGSYS